MVLFVGAAAVQYGTQTSTVVETSTREQDPLIGFLAVIAACCTSGFAGVYLELMLKNLKTSLWVKNVQLAGFGIIFGLLTAMFKDGASIRTNGFFYGYSPVVWLVILDVSAGGLLVALVVKYADSIRKGFATSISILLSTVISALFMGFSLTTTFTSGMMLVLGATLLYVRPEKDPQLPVSSKV